MTIAKLTSATTSTTSSTYQPRSINGRVRRTKVEIEAIEQEIYEICAAHNPLSVRNLFYVLVSRDTIPKTENAYKNTVVRLAGVMRERGDLPWHWLVDSTRWMRKPRSFSGLADVLEQTAELYRRDLWVNSDQYVEIWCESDSIAGVIYGVTEAYDAPLMAAHGFSSKAFLYGAAGAIAATGKPTTIYYIGDYDPSGVVARNDVRDRLARYLDRWFGDFSESLAFVPLAVTRQQIRELRLPTKPAKIAKNTHATAIGWNSADGTVEAEAIEPAYLRSILRDALESHVDREQLAMLRLIEAEERETLMRLTAEVGE
jgi:hypothetical protein